MQKSFVIALLFLCQMAQSQYVRYRMDILSGKINGKEMMILSGKIQADISDTNDVLKIGVNGDNERVGVKFYLIKITNANGTSYLPCMKFYFIERSGFIKEVPFKLPDFEHPLTKTTQNYSFKGLYENTTSGDNHFEIKYNYYIDGKNLKYDEVNANTNKDDLVTLMIKNLKLNDSSILKNKKIVLKANPKLQSKEIAKYLKKPVLLNYKLQAGKIGSLDCMVLETTLQFKNTDGKNDSSVFIQYMTLIKKNGVYEKLVCDDGGKDCKPIIFCDYDIIDPKKVLQ